MDLHALLESHVGALPGAVGIVARDERVELAAAGALAFGGAPMAADSIFRLASLTKPITAATLLMLVEDGRLALDDPVRRWLPELAHPVVVRTPAAPVDDVVPAARPITVFDLLSSQAGYGFPADFSLPAVQLLSAVQRDGREPQSFPAQDEWLAELAAVPMLYHPGESWLYDTCSALQGALIARVTGEALPDVVAARLLEPLGMTDTGYVVPPAALDRATTYYGRDGAPADQPAGQWSTPPAFPLGSGGMVGTAPDLLAFARMLLAGGVTATGERLLSARSVRLMTTDHTTPAQREIGGTFLRGHGWGFGGSVDRADGGAPAEPWEVPGRYGWVGGTGTSAYLVPATGDVAILLTQMAVESPIPLRCMQDFWRYAAG